MSNIMSTMNIPSLPQIPLIRSVTDLRYKAREIVSHVVEDGKTVLVTRDSDPVAVLFPVALYESLRQYIEDTKDIADLKKAVAQKVQVVILHCLTKQSANADAYPRMYQILLRNNPKSLF